MELLPPEIMTLHEQKLSDLKTPILQEVGGIKDSDCMPIAEAILLNGLRDSVVLEGQGLYFKPAMAAQASDGNLDLDTSKSKPIPFDKYIKLIRAQALAINFPKNALTHAELKKAVEFSATQLVNKIQALLVSKQQQAGVPLKMTRSQAEVEFQENPKNADYILIHVFCKLGLNYKKDAT